MAMKSWVLIESQLITNAFLPMTIDLLKLIKHSNLLTNIYQWKRYSYT